jgi:hypothetical protein
MVKRLVLGGSKRKRERVSLLVVELRVARDWLRTQFGMGPCSSLQIVNVLSCEISLETGVHRSSSYLTRPVPRRVAARRIHALHELNGADKWPRMPDARTGHRIPDTGYRTPDTGHRTPSAVPEAVAGQWTLPQCPLPQHPDTGRADAGDLPDAGYWTGGRRILDGRTPDTRTLTETRTGRPRHGGHPDVPGATAPLGRQTALLSARAALGNHDGSAVRPPARAPECGRTARPLLGRSAGGQAAPRRTALLRRFRVESRASGEASSVMARAEGGV